VLADSAVRWPAARVTPTTPDADRYHGEYLASMDWLGVLADAGHEQDDQTGRQRWLYDGQRGEQQGEDVEPEARDHRQATGKPAPE